MVDLSLEGVRLGLLASNDHEASLASAADQLFQSCLFELTEALFCEYDDNDVDVRHRIDALHIEVLDATHRA